MASPPAPLTEAEKDFFLANGYLRLTNCFTHEQAADMTSKVWTRLGMSATDKSTWRTTGRINMPHHREFDSAVFAPRAWAAICEVCGGEERVDPKFRYWRDSLIVNLGTPENEGRFPAPGPKELDNWHVDGDFFIHHLDSGGLLVIPLFTDIVPDGGGTMICPEGVDHVARWLYEHPEGVSPRMVPRGHPDFAKEKNLKWYIDLVQKFSDDSFVEVTGQVGDVYLLHPLMVHSATLNPLRRVRIITNPPISLREPHRFDRSDDGSDYSLVEQKTIRAVGGEGKLKGWKITSPREGVVPLAWKIKEEMRLQELKRMQEEEERKKNNSDNSMEIIAAA